jgi:chromosome segregation ATPase
VSRLSRAKEKAEREKNNLNRQLLQRQREKVNMEGDRRKLLSQKNADNNVLTTLNNVVRSTRSKLYTSTNTKVQTEHQICSLTERIGHLKNLLQTTDRLLKRLRETKTKVLSILTELKTIRSEKLSDLKEMEEVGDDIEDLLEDIKQINEAIKKSVETLLQITCGPTFNYSLDASRMKLAPSKCAVDH